MGRYAVGPEPQFLKEIVYRMRFDEASARYAEFGPFFTSYVMSPRNAAALPDSGGEPQRAVTTLQ